MDDVRHHTVVRVVDEVIVDLMGRACGPAYADVAADLEWHDLSAVRVPIASPAALVRMKNPYRPQDATDRAFLQQNLFYSICGEQRLAAATLTFQ